MSAIAPEIVATIILIVLAAGVNFAISAVLRGKLGLTRETKLRASILWRNTLLLITTLVFLYVWRGELQAAALSLAALSVALVIAGKELLTSVLGYIHRTTSGSFRFGDVIEINGIKGEVIDQTLLSTTVLEMSEEHQFTGRVAQFPNSFYVSHPLKNHSRLGDYQLGLLTVSLAPNANIQEAKSTLEEVANSVCTEYVAPTQAALRELEGEQFVLMPSAEPRVIIRMAEAGKVSLTLRYPCPSGRRTRTEQEILSRYLSAVTEMPPPPCESAPARQDPPVS